MVYTAICQPVPCMAKLSNKVDKRFFCNICEDRHGDGILLCGGFSQDTPFPFNNVHRLSLHDLQWQIPNADLEEQYMIYSSMHAVPMCSETRSGSKRIILVGAPEPELGSSQLNTSENENIHSHSELLETSALHTHSSFEFLQVWEWLTQKRTWVARPVSVGQAGKIPETAQNLSYQLPSAPWSREGFASSKLRKRVFIFGGLDRSGVIDEKLGNSRALRRYLARISDARQEIDSRNDISSDISVPNNVSVTFARFAAKHFIQSRISKYNSKSSEQSESEKTADGLAQLKVPGHWFCGDFWSYNVEKRRWKHLDAIGSPPSPRAYASIECIPDHFKLVLYGGLGPYSLQPLSDIHVCHLPPFGDTEWSTPIIHGPKLGPRLGCSIVHTSGGLLIYGGRTSSKLRDTTNSIHLLTYSQRTPSKSEVNTKAALQEYRHRTRNSHWTLSEVSMFSFAQNTHRAETLCPIPPREAHALLHIPKASFFDPIRVMEARAVQALTNNLQETIEVSNIHPSHTDHWSSTPPHSGSPLSTALHTSPPTSAVSTNNVQSTNTNNTNEFEGKNPFSLLLIGGRTSSKTTQSNSLRFNSSTHDSPVENESNVFLVTILEVSSLYSLNRRDTKPIQDVPSNGHQKPPSVLDQNDRSSHHSMDNIELKAITTPSVTNAYKKQRLVPIVIGGDDVEISDRFDTTMSPPMQAYNQEHNKSVASCQVSSIPSLVSGEACTKTTNRHIVAISKTSASSYTCSTNTNVSSSITTSCSLVTTTTSDTTLHELLRPLHATLDNVCQTTTQTHKLYDTFCQFLKTKGDTTMDRIRECLGDKAKQIEHSVQSTMAQREEQLQQVISNTISASISQMNTLHQHDTESNLRNELQSVKSQLQEETISRRIAQDRYQHVMDEKEETIKMLNETRDRLAVAQVESEQSGRQIPQLQDELQSSKNLICDLKLQVRELSRSLEQEKEISHRYKEEVEQIRTALRQVQSLAQSSSTEISSRS